MDRPLKKPVYPPDSEFRRFGKLLRSMLVDLPGLTGTNVQYVRNEHAVHSGMRLGFPAWCDLSQIEANTAASLAGNRLVRAESGYERKRT